MSNATIANCLVHNKSQRKAFTENPAKFLAKMGMELSSTQMNKLQNAMANSLQCDLSSFQDKDIQRCAVEH